MESASPLSQSMVRVRCAMVKHLVHVLFEHKFFDVAAQYTIMSMAVFVYSVSFLLHQNYECQYSYMELLSLFHGYFGLCTSCAVWALCLEKYPICIRELPSSCFRPHVFYVPGCTKE